MRLSRSADSASRRCRARNHSGMRHLAHQRRAVVGRELAQPPRAAHLDLGERRQRIAIELLGIVARP